MKVDKSFLKNLLAFLGEWKMWKWNLIMIEVEREMAEGQVVVGLLWGGGGVELAGEVAESFVQHLDKVRPVLIPDGTNRDGFVESDLIRKMVSNVFMSSWKSDIYVDHNCLAVLM